MLLCISKQTKNIVENVLKRSSKTRTWAVKYVPHGIDPEKKYFPIINDLEFEVWKEKFLEGEKYDFVVMLWNSRNIRRKNAIRHYFSMENISRSTTSRTS